jgi:hypothetical protein
MQTTAKLIEVLPLQVGTSNTKVKIILDQYFVSWFFCITVGLKYKSLCRLHYLYQLKKRTKNLGFY